MNEFEVGDRVQDCIWDGRYVGTVKRIFNDGDLSVKFDGYFAEYQMGPDQVERIDEREVA